MESVGRIAIFIPKPKIRVWPIVRSLDNLCYIVANGRGRQRCKFVQMRIANVTTGLKLKWILQTTLRVILV